MISTDTCFISGTHLKKGRNWTAGFSRSELWELFAAADDPRYESVATTWTSGLRGNENKKITAPDS
jgi:hypothetical protein